MQHGTIIYSSVYLRIDLTSLIDATIKLKSMGYLMERLHLLAYDINLNYCVYGV